MLRQRNYSQSRWCGTGEGNYSSLLTDDPLQIKTEVQRVLITAVSWEAVRFRNFGIALKNTLFSVPEGAFFLFLTVNFLLPAEIRHKVSLFSWKFNFPLIHWKMVEDRQSTPWAQNVSLKCLLMKRTRDAVQFLLNNCDPLSLQQLRKSWWRRKN